MRELIENADDNTKQELERLIAGGTIEKPIHEDITYGDIYKSQDNLWNFLFLTGYLKTVEKSFIGQRIYMAMKIPNEEISYIYKNNIREWFMQCIGKQDLSGLVKALEEGDCETASDIITGQLMDTISFYDYKEDYYHGFMAGLLRHNNKYILKSNRESGSGRYDLCLKTMRIRKGRVILLELKV
ncbi:AAA family ATPase, partial [bacterium D16-59]